MEQKTEKIKNFVKNNSKWLLLFVCLIIFLAIAEDVFEREIMTGDMIGYHIISTYLISDFVTPIAKLITRLGGAIVLISLSIIFLIVIKNKKMALSITINLGIITILNVLLKNIVQRPRPTEYRMISETGYSFPSGHSMVSMAFYGYLIYLTYKNIKNVKLKWCLITILSILIISIGTSRIYLGVHYTSDVIAGFMISISYLVIYTSIVKKFLLEREKKNEK